MRRRTIESVRIAVPDLISNSYFPAIAAVDLGFFEEQGVSAELELCFPVTAAMERLRTGEYDFVAGAAHSTLFAFPNWDGARLLAAVAQRMYWFLVLHADLNVGRGDLSATKGLRIGAAPGPDAGLSRLLLAAGIDPERDGVVIAPVPQMENAGISFGVTAARALEEGLIDGFWANGMGAAVALQRGVGQVVVDIRRDEHFGDTQLFTFPALVTTRATLINDYATAAAAVRALVKAQGVLRKDSNVARQVASRRFPPRETELISDLVTCDSPFYEPAISEESIAVMNSFAWQSGNLTREVPYQEVVAVEMRPLWQAAPE